MRGRRDGRTESVTHGPRAFRWIQGAGRVERRRRGELERLREGSSVRIEELLRGVACLREPRGAFGGRRDHRREHGGVRRVRVEGSWRELGEIVDGIRSPGGGLPELPGRRGPGGGGIFYLYNVGAGRLYRTEDGGDHWNAVDSSLASGDVRQSDALRIHASPRAEGDLWITQGRRSSYDFVPGRDAVYRSRDGGRTKQIVSGLLYAYAVGFGKGRSASIPAVYISGADSSGRAGLFRSLDDGASWSRIDDDAHPLGEATSVVGDPCIATRVYTAGPAATGIVYGEEGVNENTCSGRVDVARPVGTDSRRNTRELLIREGRWLRGSAAIELVDLAGRLRRRGRPEGGWVRLDLRGLDAGVYRARCGDAIVGVVVE